MVYINFNHKKNCIQYPVHVNYMKNFYFSFFLFYFLFCFWAFLFFFCFWAFFFFFCFWTFFFLFCFYRVRVWTGDAIASPLLIIKLWRWDAVVNPILLWQVHSTPISHLTICRRPKHLVVVVTQVLLALE